jgi:hypothetical protein
MSKPRDPTRRKAEALAGRLLDAVDRLTGQADEVKRLRQAFARALDRLSGLRLVDDGAEEPAGGGHAS